VKVPSEFKPTLENRGWLVAPFNKNPVWTALLAVFPALLGTILIFMDQQITAVIVNRKENKLKVLCNINFTHNLMLYVLLLFLQRCIQKFQDSTCKKKFAYLGC